MQETVFNIQEWELMTGLVLAAKQVLTIEKKRFPNFAYIDEAWNMNFLMQVSPRDGDKRALTRSTVLKSIFLVVEKEFQVVRDLREFRALNFQMEHNNRQIATGELSLHDQ